MRHIIIPSVLHVRTEGAVQQNFPETVELVLFQSFGNICHQIKKSVISNLAFLLLKMDAIPDVHFPYLTDTRNTFSGIRRCHIEKYFLLLKKPHKIVG